MSNAQFRFRGFTLVELAIVLFIITLLMGGVLTPLTQQINLRHERETRRVLLEARTALVGYALGHRDREQRPYLPCPDRRDGLVGANDGIEDRLDDGRCATVAGNLPWISLGMAETDAWGNRLTYAVAAQFAHAGQGIGLTSIPSADLRICPDTACRQPIAVAALLLSHGGNGLGARNSLGRDNQPPAGTDERENLDGDHSFVSRPASAADRPGGEFDDLAAWLAPDYLIGLLWASG